MDMAPKNDFVALHSKDMEWEEDTASGLPKGVMRKVLFQDPETGRRDVLVKFPPGYREPAHVHEASHGNIILEGKMIVGGIELGPGDYIFGWDKEHGPFYYPEGCTLFAVTFGKSMLHKYKKES
jgi:hypothetical protein